MKSMSYKRSKMSEDKFKLERAQWTKTKESLVSEYEKLVDKYIADKEAEMTNVKRELDDSKRQETDTKNLVMLAEEHMERKRKEWLNIEKQMMANRTILIEDRNYIEAELLNTKKALERSELLEFEAQTKLILDEESLEQERSDWKETKEALLNKNTELADKYTALETELLDTKKALERSEIHKFEGQQKLVLAEEHMNRESEAMKELLTLECTKFEKKNSAQKTELQSVKKQLEKNKCLEIELQAKLRSTEEALKRKERSLQALVSSVYIIIVN